ncbi:MAG: histidine phosphatase family protein [Planctomycetota bacterium]
MSLIEYPADDSCLLYLIRHGATDHNMMRPPRLQGAGINGPLAELGREQAARVAEVLAARPITEVLSSPMIRARQTAEAIAALHGLPVAVDENLIEVNVGRWEDKTWADIQEHDAAAYAAFREDPFQSGYPEGESLGDVVRRVSAVLTPVMERNLGREVVVVAHSVVNRSYLGSVLGLPPAVGYNVMQLNCAINIVRYNRGKTKVLTLNAVGHLM